MKGREKMASRSLKSQVLHAVSSAFYGDQERGIKGGFGVSKHSDKAANQKNGKIYSYDSYNNRQDVQIKLSKISFPILKKKNYITSIMKHIVSRKLM